MTTPATVAADVVIVGAGAAGLAAGACLRRGGVRFVILEREQSVGASWRRRYDRLHLHTDRDRSALPFLPFPKGTPRYPSRDQVVAYLEGYARAFQLSPRFGEEVQSLHATEGEWSTTTPTGTYRSRCVVVASGNFSQPYRPTWSGIDRFGGPVIHTAEYRSGERFRGQRVLVIGCGNSGGEIAIDLFEHGATPTLAVRGPVNIIPRDLFGIPMTVIALAMSPLPSAVADAIGAPLLRISIGDVSKLGFVRPPYGPMEQVRRTQRIPFIDVGTLALMREGKIAMAGDVRAFQPGQAQFADGQWRDFDAVVLATGYRPEVSRFLEVAADALDEHGVPRASGREALPGLFFCGFRVTPTGVLREIGIEARRLAREVARSVQRAA